MSELLDVSGEDRDDLIEQAAAVLRDGKLVVLPTDTVYGIAANAFDTDATAALLDAKRRDRAVPLPVMIRSPKQLAGLAATVPTAADNLVAAFWPGPLTLVLHAKPKMAWDLGDTDGTLSVRMPLDEVTLALIHAVGPLAVTAANVPGQPAPTTVGEARTQLGEAVELFLDDGPREDTAGSTIVDLTRARPQVLREGAIAAELALDVAEGRVDPLEAAALFAGAGEEVDAAATPDDDEPVGEQDDTAATLDDGEPVGEQDDSAAGNEDG